MPRITDSVKCSSRSFSGRMCGIVLRAGRDIYRPDIYRIEP